LKKNVRACESICHDFIHQLSHIYMDLLHLYKNMSDSISQGIAQQGAAITRTQIVKSMRVVKKEALKLIGTWVSLSEDPAEVAQKFIPPLLEAVLMNYRDSIPEARDAEVLNTMTKVVCALREHIAPHVLPIFNMVFDSTLQMISGDHESFPEYRSGFYNLLLAITQHCFVAYTQFTAEHFQLVVHAIVWGFRHPIRSVAETSLKVTHELLTKVAAAGGDFAQGFYGQFYVHVLENIFGVLTDSTQYCHLNQHAAILQLLFRMVEQNHITSPLNPVDQTMSNQLFVRQYIAHKLREAFEHLRQEQIETIVQGFFSYSEDLGRLKAHLRDFLVESKEIAGESMEGVCLEERKQAMAQAETEKQARLRQIPGMIAPGNADLDMG